MTKKMKKESGFTLVEMLIVVAIIAILIAVSIPLVNGALEKAREATDAANERSFKAALVTGYLLDNAGMAGTTEKVEVDTPYVYDAVNGTVKAVSTNITAYGKSNGKTTMTLYGFIDDNGEVKMEWITANSTSTTTTAITNSNLLSTKLIAPTTP